ncbi:MAG: TIGR00730 family Rossman fold protein [Pseudomonadota bacterium]
MSELKAVCVYCGSATGSNPAFVEAATILGQSIAGAGLRLVYGGGSTGLMGTAARAALDAGGQVTGIIPEFLVRREIMLEEVQDLTITTGMHDRKQLMFEKSDAFVALPGGIGTLEETVEMLTWIQLGQHIKPVVLANIEGFWDPLLRLFDHMRGFGFIRPNLDLTYNVISEAGDIVPAIQGIAERLSDGGDTDKDAPTLSKL